MTRNDQFVQQCSADKAVSPFVRDKFLRRKLWAARAGFFTGGFTVASWAPIIPFVQKELMLEPAVLGALLFGLGIGSFVGMPLAGAISRQIGSRNAIAVSGLSSCLLLVILAMIPGFYIECAALFLYGITLGCLEVSVNIYGASLEKEVGSPVMSGLHAAYSIGEVLSAGAVTAMLVTGMPLLVAIGALMLVLSVMLMTSLRGVPNTYSSDHGAGHSFVSFAPPRGRILVIALLCMAVFLAEGAMLDWSAIYIHSIGGIEMCAAGLGYTLFVMAMAISRLGGDYMVNRFGAARVLYVGLLMNIGTLVAMVVYPQPIVLFICLFVMGLGMANVAPVLISAAASIKGLDATAAITTVTTVGYGGLMAGPALLGFIAQHWSLQTALGFVAVLLSVSLINHLLETHRKAPAAVVVRK